MTIVRTSSEPRTTGRIISRFRAVLLADELCEVQLHAAQEEVAATCVPTAA